MIKVLQVIERMPKGGPIIRVNIRLGNEAGGTCIMIDTSYISDMSMMSYTSDTSNEYQSSTLTFGLETRLVVPVL